MSNLRKFEKVYKESEEIKKLEEEGYIINSENVHNIKTSEDLRYMNANWREKRVFITGITGFCGSHLTERLLDLQAEVYGLVRRHSVPKHDNINHLKNNKSLHLIEGDLTSQERLIKILRNVEPEHVFHLGAESFVPTSFREPERVIKVNVGGTVNLLEACCVTESIQTSIQLACSSEQYGLVKPDEIPIKEDNRFRPRSVYGITKVATEYLGRLYADSYNLPIIITRAFNHEGPRRGLQFFTSVVHRQLAENLYHMRKNIIIGNPNSVRDFSHVEDVVDGYLLCAEKSQYAIPYNICSGLGITMGNYVKIACDSLDIDSEILIDKNRMRPSEVPILIGDNSKIKEIGWKPQKTILNIMGEGFSYFMNNMDLLKCETH